MSDLPLYVPCPRCKGEKLVWACTSPGDGWFPTRWESFDCPLCHATGQADRELAEEWVQARADEEVSHG